MEIAGGGGNNQRGGKKTERGDARGGGGGERRKEERKAGGGRRRGEWRALYSTNSRFGSDFDAFDPPSLFRLTRTNLLFDALSNGKRPASILLLVSS